METDQASTFYATTFLQMSHVFLIPPLYVQSRDEHNVVPDPHGECH